MTTVSESITIVAINLEIYKLFIIHSASSMSWYLSKFKLIKVYFLWIILMKL